MLQRKLVTRMITIIDNGLPKDVELDSKSIIIKVTGQVIFDPIYWPNNHLKRYFFEGTMS